jgi:hypothetical protein
MRALLITIAAIALIGPAVAQEVNEPVKHSGSPHLNRDVRQDNIDDTICVSGWTKTVRPSEDTTNQIKRDLLTNAGLPWSDRSLYELDHVVPLELGGAPDDIANLNLQLWPDARRKDEIEFCLNRAVCSRQTTLNTARAAIWQDWEKAETLCHEE